MPWTLSAAGDTAGEDAELKLHAELAGVLARPGYGCASSHFGGSHASGTVHLHHDPATTHEHHAAAAPPHASHGQRAYEAYKAHAGSKSVHGEPLPSWDDQAEEVRQHWHAAAAAAR